MLSFGQLCRRLPDVKVFLCRELHKSYYDSLGLTPKASQGDIKNAYYKMSMVFHPDKGAGNPAKFQEISTAYEVLGNNKLRKLYDKGLLPSGASKYTEVKAEQAQAASTTGSSQNSGHQERHYDNYYDNVKDFEAKPRSKGPHTGKTAHFDYDAWTQSHYSETFAKQEFRKEESIRRKKIKLEQLKRLENIISSIFIAAVIVSIYCAMTMHYHDYVPISKRND